MPTRTVDVPKKVLKSFSLPSTLFKSIKIEAVEQGRYTSDVVTEAIERYLKERRNLPR